MRFLSALLVAAVVLGSPAPSTGQTVSQVLDFLVTNQSIDTGSIERDRAAAQAASVTISRALAANLATLPITTSSGAFSYRLNPTLGTVERATETFGPFFVERALPAGRLTASAGVSIQHLRFDALDGRRLRDGSLVTTANQFADESEPFDIDRLRVDIAADVATVYGTVGLTDRVDIGLALPMIALRLEGSRVNIYRDRTFTQATASATAVGFADAVVRSKVLLFYNSTSAFAAAVDVRLPTGRKEDLLGAGTRSIKMAGVGSLERGPISSHANVAFSTGGLAPEFIYGGAVAAALSSRLTLVGELDGRVIDSPGHLVMAAAPHPTFAGVNTLRLVPASSRLHTLAVMPGLKWNVVDTWVLIGSVGVPLTQGGLTTSITPFVGLDYVFGQLF
jgi:hypothetical protein